MQRNRPDDTDPLEDAEEERLTDDEVEPSSTEGMSNLMDAMRERTKHCVDKRSMGERLNDPTGVDYNSGWKFWNKSCWDDYGHD